MFIYYSVIGYEKELCYDLISYSIAFGLSLDHGWMRRGRGSERGIPPSTTQHMEGYREPRRTESDDERCDSCSVGTPATDTASHVFRFLFDCVSKVKSKSRCNSALVCDMGGGGKQTLGIIVDLIGVINQTPASIFKFTTDY